MTEIHNILESIALTRRELKNIRQEVMKLKAKLKQETEYIKFLLSSTPCNEERNNNVKDQNENSFDMVPIGFISSCFKNKNGIPRQPSLCQSSKANLKINKTFFSNPEHSLIGLNEFSYIWILFVFHKNQESSVKAKVHPPRMNGTSVGVFSTRSPHRPCAIGLSLTKLEKITGDTLFLSGVDLLDGTPVLDIKPYIPSYDIPKLCENREDISAVEDFSSRHSKGSPEESSNHSAILQKTKNEKPHSVNQNTDFVKPNDDFQTDLSANSVKTMLKMPSNNLDVLFTDRATKDIERFHSPNHKNKCEYCLDFINGPLEAKQAIVEILQNDPRSVYRKNKCSDKLYFFEVDKLHVTCWFDDMIAEVLKVKLINKGDSV